MQRQGKIPRLINWQSPLLEKPNYYIYISTKISRTVVRFAKLRHSVPQHTLLTFYWSRIHPYISILPWGQASKTFLNKILLLQKRVLRFIFFANQRESAILLFVKASIPPLNIIYFQSVASLVYDVIHENCPDNLLQLFTQIKDTHSYNTRSASSNNLYTQSSRLKTQQYSFSRIATKLWNSIPNSFRNSWSLELQWM